MSATDAKGAEQALNELKKQAKRLSKEEDGPQHKQCLQDLSKRAGFRDWQHARHILTGKASSGEDFGTLWMARPSGGFLNEWHARYDEAQASWQKQPGTFLLPYKTQFVIVGRDLMVHQGMADGDLPDGLDLMAETGSPLWELLYRKRLRTVLHP